MRGFCLFRLFRQANRQDAVLIVSRGLCLIDIVDVERAAHRARATLAADVIALLVFLVVVFGFLRGNRQVMILIRQGDILFLEARQFSRELIARTIVLDIDLEVRSLEVRQERLIEDIKQTIKIIFLFCEIMTRCKWNQTKHKANPLSATCRSGTQLRVAVRELLNILNGISGLRPFGSLLRGSLPRFNYYCTTISQNVNRSNGKN